MANQEKPTVDAEAQVVTPEAEATVEEPTEIAETSEPGETPAGLVSHDQLVEVQRELEAALAKADENWNQYVRARAEMENVRRRAERDLENAHKYGIEKLASEMLLVKDSLEMGISAGKEEGADPMKLQEGVELTLKMLSKALIKFGIEELDPKGERFNPERHEAMATQPSSEFEPNTVMQVIQKGYLLNERVLRPAMVIVARADDS